MASLVGFDFAIVKFLVCERIFTLFSKPLTPWPQHLQLQISFLLFSMHCVPESEKFDLL